MRFVLATLICLLTLSLAWAEKPVYDTQLSLRIPCGLTNVIHDWDFATGDQGFTTSACDDQGAPVWEYGATGYVDGAPGNVWGTILEGDYLLDAGQALVSPSFEVTENAHLLEVVHYFSMENLWDGGNVKVNGNLLTPIGGYPGMISIPGDWYSWCVDYEFGFTGLESGWTTACFDLSSYIGQTVQLSFEFGSDDYSAEAGWYLASAKVGNDGPVATQSRTWSGLKSLYR